MIDIKKYIESGIITEYVLGVLSDKEAEEVRKLADVHPEIAQEIEATWMSLSVFVDMGATDPPDYMEDRIWKEVSLLETTQMSSVNTKSNIFVSKSSFFYSLIAILSLVSIVAITWAITNNNQLRQAKEQIVELNSNNNELSKSVEEFKNWKSEQENVAAEYRSVYSLPNSQVILLNPNKKNAPNALIFAIWDKDNGDIYLDIKKLEPDPKDKQYQLWAISQIGRQIDLGLFSYEGENKLIKLGSTKKAVKLLITLENEYGSNIPSLLNQYASARCRY